MAYNMSLVQNTKDLWFGLLSERTKQWKVTTTLHLNIYFVLIPQSMWTITNCDVGVFHKICFPSLPDSSLMSATAVQDKHCLKAQCQQITIAGLLKCRAHIHCIARTYRLIHFLWWCIHCGTKKWKNGCWTVKMSNNIWLMNSCCCS